MRLTIETCKQLNEEGYVLEINDGQISIKKEPTSMATMKMLSYIGISEAKIKASFF